MDWYVFRLSLNAFPFITIRKPRTTHAHPPLLQSKPPQINASHGPPSSTSIDDMLTEAPVAHDHGPLPPGQYNYPPPLLHPQTHRTHTPHPSRSPSLTQSHATSVEMYPGPGQGAGMHSCQAYVFVPPVTGPPPARKSNTSGMASSLGRGGGLAGGSHYRNNFLFYADSIIQETFLTTKPMCWVLAGIRQRMLRDNGVAASADLLVVIKMENVFRDGIQDLKDVGQFVTSQCSSLGGSFRFQCYFNRSPTYVLRSITGVAGRRSK